MALTFTAAVVAVAAIYWLVVFALGNGDRRCTHCGSPAVHRAGRLGIWERLMSPDIRPYRCEVCDEQFFSPAPPERSVPGVRNDR